MSQYCKGTLVPRQIKTQAIAIALDVSEAWLMGYDVPMGREKNSLAGEWLGSIMDALGEIGAITDDGSLSSRGRDVVTDMLRNNADLLKKFIDNEN